MASADAWPPQAWTDGRMGDLDAETLTLLLAGLRPGTPEAAQVRHDLQHLDALPSGSRDLATTALRGLGLATWHQERALAALTPAERDLMRAAPATGPRDEATRAALARIDLAEVWAAQLALQDASAQVLRGLQQPKAEAGFAHDVAARLGAEGTALSAAAASVSLEDAFARLSGLPAGSAEVQEAAASIPADARPALQQVFAALLPLGAGHAAAQPEAVAALARAVESARPALLAWSEAAAAEQGARTLQPPALVLPDPDAARPPLRLGLPALTDGRGGEPRDLAAALAELARALGDPAGAAAAPDAAARVEAADPSLAAPIADVLHAAAAYVTASEAEARGTGPLAAPASEPATWDSLAAAAAQQELLAAVERLVASLSARRSEPTASGASCTGGTLADLLPGYLAIDPCQAASTWEPGDQAVLLVDTGGDDTYLGRHGGAPFQAPPPAASKPNRVPVSIVVDLGGNDTYDSLGEECAQGAACADAADGNDTAGLAGVQPVGILVDWDGDGAHATNAFAAGARSQGYAGDAAVFSGGSALDDPTAASHWVEASTGLLVERVGRDGTLHSSYTAGAFSQGAGLYNVTQGKDGPDRFPRGSRGELVRLVGSGSHADATFQAADHSQGASHGGLPVPAPSGSQGNGVGVTASGFCAGLLLNVAGQDASSNDTYSAGEWSQASVSQALHPLQFGVMAGSLAALVDAGGPGSRSDDRYRSADRSLGYQSDVAAENVTTPTTTLLAPFTSVAGVGPQPNQRALHAVFLDAVAPPLPDASSARADPAGGVVEVDPRTSPSSSADQYNVTRGPEGAFGRNGASFVDLGGHDDYPSPAGGVPDNDKSWGVASLDDGDLDDADRDAMPAGVEGLWQQFVGLWRADDGDARMGPGPAPARILVDATGTALHLDEPYALVLTTGGEDTYLANFSAAAHLDLAGKDTHLDAAASGWGVAGRAQRLPATSPAAPLDRPLLSFLLDLRGDDRYRWAGDRAQGSGGDGGAGLLFDLDGRDEYVSGNRSQGYGANGGVGVLVDAALPGSAAQSNRFQAQAPSQGRQEGGVGVLAATGGHNSFADGAQPDAQVPAAPDGPDVHPDPGMRPGFGLSANLGKNTGPSFEWAGPANNTQAAAGVPVTFSATLTDPEGDPMSACWTIQPEAQPLCVALDGNGTAVADYAWLHVPAQAGGDDALPYEVKLDVRDSGGLSVASEVRTILVHDPAPHAGGLLGPAVVHAGNSSAYQVPFAYTPAMEGHTLLFDAGDGTGNETFGDRAVDWASAAAGATIRTPAGYSDENQSAKATSRLDQAIDGDATTYAILQSAASNQGPIHAEVRFAGPRQVRSVQFVAALSNSSEPVRLAVDAIGADGTVTPLETVTVTAEAPKAFAFDLRTFPALSGIALTQVMGGSDPGTAQVYLHSLSANGPGALHTWPPGRFNATARLFDRFGAMSEQASATLDSVGAKGTQEPPPPLLYLGIGGMLADDPGRGPVVQASLAADQEYTLLLQSNETHPGSQDCVDWGDGSGLACYAHPGRGQNLTVPGEALPTDQATGQPPPAPQPLTHSWTQGDHNVVVTWRAPGVPERTIANVTVHAETALDLRATLQDPQTVAALGRRQLPVLYLSLDDTRTWHQGIPFLATIDAGGDDRYLGRVAAPLNVTAPGGTGLDLGAFPSLVVDAAGDDDYLSLEGAAQAFAARGAAALLADAGGDDLYVSPFLAQGAASEGGAAVLADLGGDDRFDPVPADHPDVARGYANRTDAWTGRPASLTGAALPLPDNARFLQGAAIEGIGILALSGGLDLVQAHAGSQGFGEHEVDTAEGYAEADPDCAPQTVGDPALYAQGTLCAFGVKDTNPNDYVAHYVTPLQNGANPSNPPPGSPGGTAWCKFGGTVLGIWGPCKQPDRTGLQAQATTGPRPGPGFGALLQSDGILAALSGSSSQGSSTGLGRGVLADSDGGDLLLASTASQAASHGGTAAVLLGGGSAMRLLSDGQGSYSDPSGPTLSASDAGVFDPDGRSIFVAPGAHLECSPGPCSGDDGSPGRSLAPDALDDAAAGPAVTVSGAPSGVQRDGTVHLHVDVDGTASSYDFRVLRVVRAWAGAPGTVCAGPALAPPRLLATATGPSGLAVAIDLDAADGREAGCTEVHAFARPSLAGGPWGHGVETVHLLPPPGGLTAEAANLVASGSGDPPILNATLAEPLARSLPPTLQVRYEGPAGQADVGAGSAVPDALGRVFVPLSVPPSLPDGAYNVSLRARWPSSDLPSPWRATPATLAVDRSPPAVLPDALPAQWPRAEPLRLHGFAQDVSGVAHLSLRLVDASGEPLPLLPGPRCLDESPAFDHDLGRQCVPADLVEAGPGAKEWSAAPLATESFLAGPVTLQVRAVDVAGADSGWRPAGGILLDAEAPSLVSLATPAGSDSVDPSAGLALVATLADDIAASCAPCPGSGLDLGSVRAVLSRQDGTGPRLPLARAPALDGPGRLGFRWPGAPLDAGAYAVEVFASDHAGNLRAWKPGAPLFLDDTLPSIQMGPEFTLPSFTLANGSVQRQAALKGNDTVRVAVQASDGVGVGGAQVVFGDADPQELGERKAVGSGVLLSGNVTVPDAPGPTLQAWVDVADRAGNVVRSAAATFPYHPTSFRVAGLELTPRVHSAVVGWSSDRAVHYNVTIEGPSGAVSAVGSAPAGHAEALLGNLSAGSAHAVQAEFWDDAGWLLSLDGALQTLPQPATTALEVTGVPIRVRSGAVQVSGEMIDPPAGLLTLRVGGADGQVVAQKAVAAASGLVPFTLGWDSATTHPGGLEVVPVTAVLDTGELTWSDSAAVFVDNHAPTLALDLRGATPRNGWYPGALQVGIDAADDTGPVVVEATLDGNPVNGTIAAIAEEGAHRLAITLRDGAWPPNVLHHTLDVQVDGTAPALSVAGVPRYVSDRTVAYVATASDARSGLDGLRSRAGAAGSAWSDWAAEAPANASVPAAASDGDFFLDVEARDRAGNVRRATVPFTLDRVAPEVVAARWVGWAGDPPAPVLFLAARDAINATTAPAGVAAARFAPAGSPGAWGPWVAADGRGALQVQPSWLDAGGAFLQVRDAAGNAGAVVGIPPSPPRPDAPATTAPANADASSQPPVPESAGVDPQQGTQAESFLFSAVVPSWNGHEPLEVYVKVGDVLYPAEPSGPLLEQGARLYAASVQLEPSRLAKPYTFHFVVRYDGAEVATQDLPGPLVTALGAGAAPEASAGHSSPAPGFLMAAVALALAGVVRSRRQRR